MSLRIRPLAALATAGLLVATASGCSQETAQADGGTSDAKAISADRCEQNKAAGKVTYMSGYYWQASASILEVIAADALGYFDDLCLDVELQPGPGDTSQNAKLLASGQVTFTALSQQDVITSNANGLDVLGISSYSDAGLDILMTKPDVTDLSQLAGKTLGQKGWVPLGVSAMLAKAGLADDAVQQVKVGYDPSVLPRGQVDALTGFISNEPNQLAASGEKVTVWEPADFGIPGSLGAFAVNPAFAEKHPTAVEDFLRAAFHAYQYCAQDAHVDECIGYQHKLAGAESDPKHETSVWTTETKVVADNPLPVTWGSIDPANVSALAGLIAQYMGMDVDAETAATEFDSSFADAVVDDQGQVVWPAP